MLSSAELADTVDHQPLAADAFDARAHLHEEPAEVLHMRLARGVEDLGAALGQHRGEKDVLGAGDGRQVEHDPLAAQAIDLGDDLGRRLLDARAHLAQSAQVLLHAAGADVVTTRPGQAGLAEATE